MQGQKIHLWGAADLRGFSTPDSTRGEGYPFALSYAIPMNPLIMAGIRNGPNQDYADEYVRVNDIINDLAERIAIEIKRRGFRAQSLAASERTDTVNLQGDFPHKTAATRSGLGWIGRNCQLVTRTHGPWIRLGTVFTDMTILCGPPVERSYCGRCTICIDACPAGALKGNAWYPGLPREDLLDVHACDSWKRKHYFQYLRGHTCGICSAVCPRGLKMLKQPTLSGRMPL
ncbi:MAG: epoxyqueuosine reductase [Deltaproteobacteria bacterium]|nr:epoxyqueuosine reductase [Deltaproteobacteria bacterium]